MRVYLAGPYEHLEGGYREAVMVEFPRFEYVNPLDWGMPLDVLFEEYDPSPKAISAKCRADLETSDVLLAYLPDVPSRGTAIELHIAGEELGIPVAVYSPLDREELGDMVRARMDVYGSTAKEALDRLEEEAG